MKSLFTLCTASVLALLFYAAPVFAGVAVEGVVKDAQGKVLMEGPMHESDIPALIQYITEGGVKAMYSRNILIKIGPAAVPDIIKVMPKLIDTIADDKSSAGYILGVFRGINDERLAAALAEYLNHPDERVSKNIRGVLSGYGETVFPIMVKMLADPAHHEAAQSVLSGFEPTKEGREIMRAELDSKDALMRSSAAFLLGTWRDEKSDAGIKKLLLNDPDPLVRRSAARGYFDFHWQSPETFDVDVILKSLQDQDVEVRREAVDMLGRVDDPRVEPTLIALLGTEKDHDVLGWAIIPLADRHDTEAAYPIMKLLDKDDPDQENLQTTVAWALGELGAKEATPYFMEILSDDAPLNEDFLNAMLEALIKFDEPVDIKPLLKYLDPAKVGTHCCGDDSTDLTLKLIDANAKPGDEAVVDALKRFRPSARPDQAEKIDAMLKRLQVP